MKIVKLLLALAFIFNLSSCTITEKMIVNENGSGKFSYDIDATKLMSMGAGAMGGDKAEKKNKKKREKKDIDSTFTFKEMFADKQDSIAKLSPEEQAKIKKMEKFSVRMVMKEEQGIMLYSMFTDFNSVAELQDVMSPVESMKSLSPTGKAGDMGLAPNSIEDNSSTKFYYDGKKFSKSVAKIEKKKEEEPKAEVSDESAAVAEELKKSMEMFYGQSNFKVVYQFPKPVKKISAENALFSDDRKTITVEYPLKDYMESPDKLNFDIEFQ